MTGYNRLNQRITIRKDGRPVRKERRDYYPCPECGAKMRTEKRAAAHCREVR